MAVFTLIPLTGSNTVDSSLPFGGVGAANNPPALSSPLPSPTILKDVQVNLSFASYFTDPDGDPMTYGFRNLPPGLVGNSNGTITGAASSAGSFTDPEVRALDDKGGISAWSQFTITVSEPSQPGEVWNFPWHRAFFNSSARRDAFHRDNAHPTQKLLTYRTAIQVCQGGVGMGSTSGRQTVVEQMAHYVNNRLPGARCFQHIDSNQIKLPPKPSTNIDRIAYDIAVAQGGLPICRSPDGVRMGREQSASLPERSLQTNHYNHNFTEAWVDQTLAWLTDASLPGAYVLGNGIDGYFHDAMTATLKTAWSYPELVSDVHLVNSPTSKDIQVDNWADIPTDGNPDGAGFEALTSALWLWLYLPNYSQMTGIPNLKRVRFDGGGKMTLRGDIDIPTEVTTDWKAQIHRPSRNRSAYDPEEDGTSHGSNYDQSTAGDESFFRVTNGYHYLFDYLDTRLAALSGETYGRVNNTMSDLFRQWWLGNVDIRTHAHRNALDITQDEGFQEGRDDDLSFLPRADGTGYRDNITKENDLKYLVGGLEFAKTAIQTGPVKSQGVKGIITSLKVRTGCDVNNPTTLDAAYALFYETLIMLGGNGLSMPQVHLGGGGNSINMATETLILALGGLPISEATYFTTKDEIPLSLCTIDEVTQPGGAGRVTLVPSTWGGRGWGQWHRWFPNDILVVIHAGPRTAGEENWIPSYLPGGQTPDPVLDQFILPNLPVGRAWFDWDPSSYVNPENGENSRTGLWANPDNSGVPAKLGRIDEIFTSDPSTPAGCGVFRGTGGESIAIGPREVRIFCHAVV